MAPETRIRVEVVLALRDRQELRTLELDAGATVGDAVEASGLAEAFPEVEIDPERLGIFGRVFPPDHVLRDRDRVEIYRPLKIDPREARRKRAAGS